STEVGKSIQKAAAESNLKRVLLELGGKSPSIIFADSNLDTAVKFTFNGSFFNHGQCCVAATRIYVEEHVYDEFLKFKTDAEAIKIGDPFESKTYQGPQVSRKQYDRIMSYIKTGKEEGATLLMGGERHGERGFYIKPTIFTDVVENMTIMQDEIFGPVTCIAKFKTIDEVIEKANLTKYGLAAAVFTNNIIKAVKLSKEIKAGTVWVNQYMEGDSSLPFGGYKQSGIGREMGKYALREYTQMSFSAFVIQRLKNHLEFIKIMVATILTSMDEKIIREIQGQKISGFATQRRISNEIMERNRKKELHCGHLPKEESY
ncbi:24212_t:CDS:2, partial [Gigaspora margarita]